MLREVETEYKYLISNEHFQELLSKCDNKYTFLKHKLQVNYYYDTEDNALNRFKTTVRIRQNHNKLKLQIKKHRTENGTIATSDEYSSNVNELSFTMRISDMQDIVTLKGSLITEREIYTFGENSIICFDRNMYLGICDYEIEIEISEADKQEALSVIEFLGLLQMPIMSKSERFFRRLEAMKNG